MKCLWLFIRKFGRKNRDAEIEGNVTPKTNEAAAAPARGIGYNARRDIDAAAARGDIFLGNAD
jgi:hypothetical protein